MRTSRTSTSIILELPYPPSINHYHRHVMVHGSARTLISEDGRSYQRRVVQLLAGTTGMDGRLQVTIYAWMPDRRKRDVDNLLKPLLDACTAAGLWKDDAQVRSLRIVDRGVDGPDGRIILRVKQLEPLLF